MKHPTPSLVVFTAILNVVVVLVLANAADAAQSIAVAFAFQGKSRRFGQGQPRRRSQWTARQRKQQLASLSYLSSVITAYSSSSRDGDKVQQTASLAAVPHSLHTPQQQQQQQQQQTESRPPRRNQQLGHFEPLNTALTSSDPIESSSSAAAANASYSPQAVGRCVLLYDYSSSSTCPPIPYHDAWALQKLLHEGHLNRLSSSAKTDNKTRTPHEMDSLSHFVNPKTVLSEQRLRFDALLELIPRRDTDHSNNKNKNKNEKNDCVNNEISDIDQIDALRSVLGYDSIIMLQHEPVYTLGTGSDPEFIKSSTNTADAASSSNPIETDTTSKNTVEIVRIERGGEVTYHGPGQLVVYPILDLRGYKMDVHWYMRALEEAILMALTSVGVMGATREDDVTGVWIDGKKVAALGIKARRWVTMHGLAVNVDERSLKNFEGIVPCGLEGRDVCCINEHLEEPITVEEFAVHMKRALEKILEVHMISAQ